MKQAVRFVCVSVDCASPVIPSGGNLNAASRQALMQKLARIEPTPTLPEPS
jgi:hypothetical protein